MLEANQRTVRIPVSSRLHVVDREQAQQIARWIVTPNDAKILASSNPRLWMVRQIDGSARMYVLCYKGCEMRLIFKRQVIDEVIDAGIPVPAQAIKNERQEWLSINLVDDAEEMVSGRESQEEINQLKSKSAQLEQHLTDANVRFMKERAEFIDDVVKWKSLAEKAVKQYEESQRKVHSLEADIKLRNFRTGKDRAAAEMKVLTDTANAFWPILNVLESRRKDTDWAEISVKAVEQSLQNLNVSIIRPREGDVFNPQIHNAVEIIPMEKKYEDRVVAVHSVGLIHTTSSTVLKAADVAVATYQEKEES